MSNGNGRSYPPSSKPSTTWSDSNDQGAAPLGSGDKVLECRECKNSFILTAGEQAWFTDPARNYSLPTRCKPCRQARKAQQQGQPGPAPSPAESYNRAPRSNQQEDDSGERRGRGKRGRGGSGWNDDY